MPGRVLRVVEVYVTEPDGPGPIPAPSGARSRPASTSQSAALPFRVVQSGERLGCRGEVHALVRDGLAVDEFTAKGLGTGDQEALQHQSADALLSAGDPS